MVIRRRLGCFCTMRIEKTMSGIEKDLWDIS